MLDLFVWTAVTAMLFLAGWASASFIAWQWDWPLSGWGSRLWLVICGLITFAVQTAEGYQKA